MHVLLLTIGSHGDVHPFIGLGLALQRRGHRVKIITNPIFGSLIDKAGLELVPIGTAEEFETLRANPDLWHLRKGFPTVFNSVTASLRSTYQTLLNHYIPGETVVAASSLGVAARIAQDKSGIPLATVHLAPAVIRSTIHPPKLPGLFMPGWLPRWCRQTLFDIGDSCVIDPIAAPPINQFRAELGLAPVKGILKNWWNSPQRIIGLFPQWFAPPQPDWPSQLRLTGFPLYDERGITEISPELATFLDGGDPPILFTPGSAMSHAHDFFKESVAACVKLDRRGILLSRHAEHIPKNLPPQVRHFEYAPFSEVLPRAAALVHHGGIGTSAQAMKAGVKQLVMPFCHDQLDNAARMISLGISRTVQRGKYRAPKVAAVLAELLADPAATSDTQTVAAKFQHIDPIGDTCQLIEDLLAEKSPAAAFAE